MVLAGGPRTESPAKPRPGLDDFKQKQDENDGKDQAEAAATVVSQTWTHTVASEAEDDDQDDQKDKHFLFLRCGSKLVLTAAISAVYKLGCRLSGKAVRN